MDLEDQYRFQVEAHPWQEQASVTLTCDRCVWTAIIDDPLTLADLNQRAQAHTEVCR